MSSAVYKTLKHTNAEDIAKPPVFRGLVATYCGSRGLCLESTQRSCFYSLAFPLALVAQIVPVNGPDLAIPATNLDFIRHDIPSTAGTGFHKPRPQVARKNDRSPGTNSPTPCGRTGLGFASCNCSTHHSLIQMKLISNISDSLSD